MLDRLFPKVYWTVNIGSYSFTFTLSGIIEVLIFAVLIYYVIIWIKRTKAWNLLKGGAVLLIVYLLSKLLGLNNLAYIFERFVASLLIAVIIIFQPEIRRALEQLGNRNYFGHSACRAGEYEQRSFRGIHPGNCFRSGGPREKLCRRTHCDRTEDCPG